MSNEKYATSVLNSSIEQDEAWKLADYEKPRTQHGLIGLFWKTMKIEQPDGSTLESQDYIISGDYKPEYTHGMITKDEIMAVIKILKTSPNYDLYPKKFSSKQNSSKMLSLASFFLLVLALVSLTLMPGPLKLISFTSLSILFMILFSVSCCSFWSSRTEFKHHLACRDVYFDEVLHNCNKLFEKRGVKFYYNDMSPTRDILVRVRKPRRQNRIVDGIAFEKYYLGFESIIKNAEEKKRNGKESEIHGADLGYAHKNVWGDFVVDSGRRTKMILDRMKRSQVKYGGEGAHHGVYHGHDGGAEKAPKKEKAEKVISSASGGGVKDFWFDGSHGSEKRPEAEDRTDRGVKDNIDEAKNPKVENKPKTSPPKEESKPEIKLNQKALDAQKPNKPSLPELKIDKVETKPDQGDNNNIKETEKTDREKPAGVNKNEEKEQEPDRLTKELIRINQNETKKSNEMNPLMMSNESMRKSAQDLRAKIEAFSPQVNPPFVSKDRHKRLQLEKETSEKLKKKQEDSAANAENAPFEAGDVEKEEKGGQEGAGGETDRRLVGGED